MDARESRRGLCGGRIQSNGARERTAGISSFRLLASVLKAQDPRDAKIVQMIENKAQIALLKFADN
jgi:hypothetical protein